MLERIRFVDHAACEKVLKKNVLTSLGFSVFLFIITFPLYLNLSYMGARLKEVEEIIFSNYMWLLIGTNLKILLAYLMIGLIIAAFSVMLKIEKRRYVIPFNGFVWFLFWIRGIKMYPQLFMEQLYNHGGIQKAFQLVITDYLPMMLLYGIFAAVVLLIGFLNKRPLQAGLMLLLCLLFIQRFDVASVKAPASKPEQPNLLIFATDSLRPDRISYNGYYRKTPAMDRILEKGANFLNLKASMARTLPSWTSIFTSTFPPDHQMRHMFPNKLTLKKTWTTVIDVLNKKGYYSAVISDFAGDIFPSVDYGFQEIVSPRFDVIEALKQRSQEIHYFLLGFLINPTGRLLFPEMWGMSLNKDPWYVTRFTKKKIKKAVKAGKPFFIVSFSSSNHFPYVTLYPYYSMYTPADYKGDHKYGLSSAVLQSYLEAPVASNDVAQVINLYDSATRLFDDNLQEIMTYLQKCGISNNTIVIIMSDHGENLYEENYGVGHGDHLLGPYSTNMAFGVYSPNETFSGRQIKNTARDIDIAPTILDLLHTPSPDSFKGTSLLPAMRGEPFAGLPAYMETGIWYSPTTPFIEPKERLAYPHLLHALEILVPSGKITLRKKFEDVVIRAKHKAYQLNEKKYIYMPGATKFQEAYYIDEKEVPKSSITDPEFLAFKQKIVDTFKDKFYIDPQGFIREYICDPPSAAIPKQ